MTRLSSIIITVAAMCSLQACNSAQKNTTDKDTDSFNPVPVSTTTPEREDVQFAVAAAQIGQTEIGLGKLAQQKGNDLKIKNFGVMLVKDQAKANNRLVMLANAKHITLPGTPGAGDKKTTDSLAKLSGKDFDRAYINTMIARRNSNIKTFEMASKYCADPDIKKFAKKALPRLKNQLAAINAINELMR